MVARGRGHGPTAPRARSPRGLARAGPSQEAPAAPGCVCCDMSVHLFSCTIECPNVFKPPLLCTVEIDQVCVVICQINCLSPPPTGDDCEGKKLLETHTDIRLRSSRPERVAGAIWHVFSYAGCVSHLFVLFLSCSSQMLWLLVCLCCKN